MKVINPTQENIKVQIEGNVYQIEAGGFIENVPAAHAESWRSRTHNFIILEADNAVAEEVTKESEQAVDEVPAKEEEVEEKPKASRQSKKTK